jgi:hypothetical protein
MPQDRSGQGGLFRNVALARMRGRPARLTLAVLLLAGALLGLVVLGALLSAGG